MSAKPSVAVVLPDGKVKEFESAVTVRDVAKSIGSRLAKDALWGDIEGQPVPLDHVIAEGSRVPLKIITRTDPAALATLRHSCAHVMARAVMRIKKKVQLAFGPALEDGFYYDIESSDPLSEDDFAKIESRNATDH